MVVFTIAETPMVAVSGSLTILSGLGLYAIVARTKKTAKTELAMDDNAMSDIENNNNAEKMENADSCDLPLIPSTCDPLPENENNEIT
jgi:hypothetical protein